MKHIIYLLSSILDFLALVGTFSFICCLKYPEKAFNAILSASETVRNVYPCIFVVCFALFIVLYCVAAILIHIKSKEW